VVPGGSGDPRGLTIRQISQRIDESRRRVRYHLDALCDQGVVEVSGEQRRKGVVVRYFAPTHLPMLSDDEIKGIPRGQQQKMLVGVVRAIFADVTSSLKAGLAVRRPEWAGCRVVGEADEQGWKELASRHVDLMMEATEILAASRARMQRSGEKPIWVISGSLFLEGPSPENASQEQDEPR